MEVGPLVGFFLIILGFLLIIYHKQLAKSGWLDFPRSQFIPSESATPEGVRALGYMFLIFGALMTLPLFGYPLSAKQFSAIFGIFFLALVIIGIYQFSKPYAQRKRTR